MNWGGYGSTHLTVISLLISFRYTPESLRWLLVRGKTEEAVDLCKNIARINKKEVAEGELNLEGIEVGQRLGDLRDLFGTRSIAKKTLIMWYLW